MTRFSAILADNAWEFTTYSDKGAGRSPQAHYHTMTVDKMCDLPVEQVAADDCVLFLWAVDPRLPDAIRVGQAWGFEYKTVAFYRVKQVASRVQPTFLPVNHDFHWHMGTGYWTRANCEMCLLFTRGNPKRLSMNVRRLLVSPVQEHSRKPDEIHDRIEQLVAGPYLELFGRREREGWTVLGNEIDGRNLQESIQLIACQGDGTAIIPYDFADGLDDIRLAWEYEADTSWEETVIADEATDETLYRMLRFGDGVAVQVALWVMGIRKSRRYVFTLRRYCTHQIYGSLARQYLGWIEPVTETPDIIYGEPPLPLYGQLVKINNQSPTGEKEKVS